jgi:hypothetical protein
VVVDRRSVECNMRVERVHVQLPPARRSLLIGQSAGSGPASRRSARAGSRGALETPATAFQNH